jgi:hypothetical protein
LLLPDARVVAPGGNPEGGDSVPWLPPDKNEEMRLEIFSPPHLFRGARPTITSAPDACHYGDIVTVTIAQALTPHRRTRPPLVAFTRVVCHRPW